ncbi:MAG: hypothetical protein V1799_10190 [bacterium]
MVLRHTISVTTFDSLSSLSVGNGEFAFTVDATGLQTFPEYYKNGIPLGTQSQWAWHSFPNPNDFRYKETLKEFNFGNTVASVPYQWSEPERKKKASEFFRQNPHRLHLGIIGFELLSDQGIKISPEEIKNIRQELNLWTGEIMSRFEIDRETIFVTTICHPEKDQIGVRVVSERLRSGKIKVVFRFPYPSGEHTDWACDWTKSEKHSTIETELKNSTIIERRLDSTIYFVKVDWNGHCSFTKKENHSYLLSTDQSELEFSCLFSQEKVTQPLSSFPSTESDNRGAWKTFWIRGGAVDFSLCTDKRAKELERRVVLSQYLTKIQCSGSLPPQETGLTYNSWYGKFHLEMHWWHGVHFALWNRIDLLEKSLVWYRQTYTAAKAIAARQGFKGVRWPKMTDPEGMDSPSKIGPFLLWQQPHIIYFSELCYRHYRNRQTLEKYKNLVFDTADFMASCAQYDSTNKRFILGKGIIPAQERFNPEETFNTPFELAYWRWGLSTALIWCDRLGLPQNPEWVAVLSKLSSLPQKDDLYLAAESAPDSYSNPRLMTDHPAVLGIYGMLDGSGYVDTTIMKQTFHTVLQNWHWEETWGWDFPFTAMAATRLHSPEQAIEALFMNQRTNTYLVSGHNYQDGRLRLYLPGNGALLSAVAMMCAGFEGNTISTPGFPKDETWNVRWEGLNPLF